MLQENPLLLKNHSPLKQAYQLVLKEPIEEQDSSSYFIEMMEKFSNKTIRTILEIYPVNEKSYQITLRKAGYEVISIALDLGINAFGGEQDGDHYIIGKDFEFPKLKQTFDAVILSQGCFGKFVSEKNTKEFLINLTRVLTKKSLLLFEFWHLPGVEKSVTEPKGHKDWEKINSVNEGSIIRLTNSKLHLNTSILSVDIHYLIERNDEVKRINESFIWRLYTISELELLLENTNFHLLNTFKFNTFDEPEFTSFRLFAICEMKD